MGISNFGIEGPTNFYNCPTKNIPPDANKEAQKQFQMPNLFQFPYAKISCFPMTVG
jgi:hypothetical protein